MQSNRRKRSYGFTILEVLLTLVLISIFAAVAVMRQPPPDVSLKAGAEQLKSHLRYAQTMAMNAATPWGIRLSAGVYSLFQCSPTVSVIDCAANSANWRILPGESQTNVDYLVQKAVTITQGDFIVSFDSWGRPIIQTGALAFSSGEAAVTLAKSDQTETLSIVENTGFVH